MLHENAPKHYTCLSCYTVALIPKSADEIKAFCPICSPAKQVSYKRGIVPKPVPKAPEAHKAEIKVPIAASSAPKVTITKPVNTAINPVSEVISTSAGDTLKVLEDGTVIKPPQ